jgi:hypothetical protein
MRISPELLKALPLGVAVPILIGSASVSPEDAASNISKWADKVGIHDLPSWLTAAAANRQVFYAGIAAALMYASVVWGIPALRSHRPEKMPILEFMHLAARRGWQILGEQNLEAVDLMDGLREAGSEGIIRFWGRLDKNGNRFLIENEIRVQMPAKHWRDYELDWTSVLSAKDNLETRTYTLRKPTRRYHHGYADICLDRAAAIGWLKTEAMAFRGRRDGIEQQREAERARRRAL